VQLLNLNIDKIIIHQVYQRDVEGHKVTPMQSHEYTNFSATAMETFKQRVVYLTMPPMITSINDGSIIIVFLVNKITS
jgi:hypothetical protein